MKKTLYLCLIVFLIYTAQAEAEDQKCESHVSPEVKLGSVSEMICVYEPNTIGFTKDSDDRTFMDFKISLRTQLFPATFTDWLGYNSAGYFAFTGRFGQYIGTRDSSPVVGKRYNPKLFFRHWYEKCHGHEQPSCPDSYYDFGYAHESNGQSINNATSLQAAKDAEASKPNGDAAFAYDQISRGWDYIEAKWKSDQLIPKGTSMQDGEKAKFDFDLSSYVDFKYFLKNGLLQGKPEEFGSTWEVDPEGKSRKEVDGLDFMGKGIAYFKSNYALKYAISLTTGYVRPFNYNTIRLEVGAKIKDWLPITLWYQNGYNSDLAQYYKHVNSVGFYVELGSF